MLEQKQREKEALEALSGNAWDNNAVNSHEAPYTWVRCCRTESVFSGVVLFKIS